MELSVATRKTSPKDENTQHVTFNDPNYGMITKERKGVVTVDFFRRSECGQLHSTVILFEVPTTARRTIAGIVNEAYTKDKEGK